MCKKCPNEYSDSDSEASVPKIKNNPLSLKQIPPNNLQIDNSEKIKNREIAPTSNFVNDKKFNFNLKQNQ